MKKPSPLILLTTGAIILSLLAIFRFSGPESKPDFAIPFSLSLPELYSGVLSVQAESGTISLSPLEARDAKLKSKKDRHIYQEAYPKTDVIQTKSPSGLKEELLFHAPGHPETFRYRIENAEDYIIKKDQNENIVFYDKNKYQETGPQKDLSRIFTIPRPFIKDQNDQPSYSAIKTEIEGNIITVSINQNWLKQAKYPLILDPVIEINILNVHSHPQEGEDWVVSFTTKGTADLYIIPDDQATIDDDEFTSLYCGEEERHPEIQENDVIYYQDWNCNEIATVTHYTKTAGQHTLKFDFGGQIAYAYNDNQTFTSSGNWTAPSNVSSVDVECWGGGGGGGTTLSNKDPGGGGGGGGGYAKKTSIPVTASSSYTVTVGTGGGQSTAGNNSSFTGDSSVNVTANGGGGGGNSGGAGGTGGSGTCTDGCDAQYNGGAGALYSGNDGGGGGGSGGTGSIGNTASGRTGATAVTGGGPGGDGGLGQSSSGDPPASGPGGGGGGAGYQQGASGAGASGYDGQCTLTWTVYTAATISSNANQAFAINQATTSIETIRITAKENDQIATSTDIRIMIATTSTDMRWDTTDTLASISGTASANASTTVSYEDNGATLVIDVYGSNFATDEYIDISGLSFTSFASVGSSNLELHIDGDVDSTSENTDDKTLAIYGSMVLDDHSLGQIGNQWLSQTSTTSVHYRYSLVPIGENINIATTTFSLSGITGVDTSNISDIKLYKNTADLVATSGAIEISGTTGQITLATSSTYLISTTTDFLLEFTTNNITTGDKMTIDFLGATSTGATSLYSISLTGDSTSTTHIYNPITISSDANQYFENGQAITGISQITVTANTADAITDANELYIAIATTTFDYRWDTTDTTASISGTASGNVSENVTFLSNSLMRITVNSDFTQGQNIIISGLNYTSFGNAITATAGALKAYGSGSYSGTPDDSDDKTVTIYGTLLLDDHSLGQVGNKWLGLTSTTSVHYRYSLAPTGENMNFGTTTFALSGITGVSASDISNIKLYKNTADLIASAGAIEIDGTIGNITLATSSIYSITGTTDFLLEFTASNLSAGDEMNIDFFNASSTGATSLYPITISGNSASITHVYGGNVIDISSAANQSFETGQANTAISAITISAIDSSTITAANDIYITIATSTFDYRFDTTDISASISGTASAKASSSVAFLSDSVLKITVTSDFASNEYIEISGLNYADFNSANAPASSSLQLYTDGAYSGTPNATDDKTVTIYGALTASDHSLGQITNQWANQTGTTSIHYRYSLVPTGESMTLGTTTFNLTGINGVSASDISNIKLGFDLNYNNIIENGDLDINWGNSDSGTIEYNSAGSYSDYLRDITIDSAGSVYVVGYSWTASEGYNFRINKYDLNGDLDTTWGDSDSGTIEYNSAGSYSDYLRAIAIDSSDAIYVAGYSTTTSEGYNFRINKYDANGDLDTTWGDSDSGTIEYNSAGSYDDYANAITIDSAGAIYVAGYSTTASEGENFRINKYDANGDLDTTWGDSDTGTIEYNSDGSFNDSTQAITIDSAGAIYVAGYSTTASAGGNFRIHKYDLNGDLDTTWGDSDSGTIVGSYYDYANAITIDSSGAIYFAGYIWNVSEGWNFLIHKYDINGDLDTTWGDSDSGTIEYNSAGSYSDVARAITIDSAGAIYVAGYSTTASEGNNFRINKYDLNGDLDTTWGDSDSGTINYNSADSYDDFVRAITIDSSDAVYVAGLSSTASEGYNFRIHKYVNELISSYGEVDISGTAGQIIFSTSTTYTISTATDLLLELTASNLATNDEMTINFNSASTSGATSEEIITISGSPTALTHITNPVTISSAANQSFETGQANTTISAITISTKKSLFINSANDIYITIATSTFDYRFDTTDTSASISGTASAKVSSSVTFLSDSVLKITVTSDFAANEYIEISGLNYANFGSANAPASSSLQLYTDGTYSGTPATTDDKTVTIYGTLTAGDHSLGQTVNQWTGQTGTTSVHYRYSLVPAGESMTLGTTTFDLTGINGVSALDISNIKLVFNLNYNNTVEYGDLNTSWGDSDSGTIEYSSADSYNDYAQAITMDSSGAIYVAGYNWTASEGYNFRINKYDLNGDLDTTWGDSDSGTIEYNSVGSYSDVALAITIDSSDAIYVAGYSTTTSEGYNFRINKYDQNGDLDTSWGDSDSGTISYNSAGSYDDIAYSITIDSSSAVYVAGRSSTASEGYNFRINKYDANGDLDTSWGDSDFGTIEYNSAGSYEDIANAITIDSSGAIYVAGYSDTASAGDNFRIHKYDLNGDLDTSWGDSDSGTIEYNSVSSHDDAAFAITIDSAGAVYVAGLSSTNSEGYNFRINKYDLNGDLDTSWGDSDSGTISYNSAGSYTDLARAITIDSSGAIYVAGYSTTASEGENFRINKYDANGDLDTTWGDSDTGTIEYNSDGSFNDSTRAITIDSSGAIYVAGVSNTASEGYNFRIHKYSFNELISYSGEVDITGTTGQITFATSTTYTIATTTDFLLELTASNLELCDQMTIDFAGASTIGATSLWIIEPVSQPSSANHYILGEITSSNHTLGQVANLWTESTESLNAVYYRYRLETDSAVRISTTTISLSGVTGVNNEDIANIKLYEDSNSDGATTSEVLVAAGALSLIDGSGSITFASSTYELNGASDYLLEISVSNLQSGTAVSTHPLRIEGTAAFEGLFSLVGQSLTSSGGGAITLDLFDIESNESACGVSLSGNPDSVTHQK